MSFSYSILISSRLVLFLTFISSFKFFFSIEEKKTFHRLKFATLKVIYITKFPSFGHRKLGILKEITNLIIFCHLEAIFDKRPFYAFKTHGNKKKIAEKIID